MKDQITEWARKNWKIIFGAAGVFVLLVIFRDLFFAIVLSALTVAVSIAAQKTKLKLLGIELVTFTTAAIGYSYGAVWGALIGILLQTINMFILFRWARTYSFWVIPSFGLAGMIAGLKFGIPFVSLGIGIAIGLHVLHAGITFITTGRLHPKYILYIIPNILFNIVIFTGFGNRALGFL